MAHALASGCIRNTGQQATRRETMNNSQHIQQIIEQAKQQRAEFIGSAFRSYAVPVVLAAGLSLVLVQFSAKPSTQTPEKTEVAQVLSGSY
jgi:hypothetical protein